MIIQTFLQKACKNSLLHRTLLFWNALQTMRTIISWVFLDVASGHNFLYCIYLCILFMVVLCNSKHISHHLAGTETAFYDLHHAFLSHVHSSYPCINPPRVAAEHGFLFLGQWSSMPYVWATGDIFCDGFFGSCHAIWIL